MPLPIGLIDHVAYAVSDLEAATAFLERVLNARIEREPYLVDGVVSVQQIRVGEAMLSLHRVGNGVALAAPHARPGTLDICFRWNGTIKAALAHLRKSGVEVVAGPEQRTSSDGVPGTSIYFRDPDGNLFELLSTIS